MRTQRSRSAVTARRPDRAARHQSRVPAESRLLPRVRHPERSRYGGARPLRPGEIPHAPIESRDSCPRHREAVRNQIGAAEDQDDAWGQMSADHSSDNGERRHSAVNAAIDPISEVALLRCLRESQADGLSSVFVFHVSNAQKQLCCLVHRSSPTFVLWAAIARTTAGYPRSARKFSFSRINP